MPKENTEPVVHKAKYWWAVLYEENMPTNWEDIVGDVVQLPYAYCRHDMDTDSMSEHRKDHVHMILVFPNTTTYKHALSVFKLLGAKAVNTCKACISIRKCYDYLIHDTETCRKQGKYLYPKECRVEGNNFDIGAYEQISQEEKDKMLMELCDFAVDNAIDNAADFYILMCAHFDFSYFQIYRSYTGAIERLCRGNWQKKNHRSDPQTHAQTHEKHTQTHENSCPECGSSSVKKKGKTAGGSVRLVCKECGKSWSI